MAITPGQFKVAGGGELESEWFPLGDLDERLDGAITLADADTLIADLDAEDQDSAKVALVYSILYGQAEGILASMPGKAVFDSGRTSRDVGQHQIQFFSRRRNYWRGKYLQATAQQSVAIR